MNDDLSRRLADQVDATTPHVATPFQDVVDRRIRRRNRRRAGLAAGSVLVAVTAVTVGVQLARPDGGSGPSDFASEAATPGRTVSTPTQPPSPDHEADSPPPLQVVRAGGIAEVKPFSFCWTGEGAAGLCADGAPGLAGDLVDVGSPDHIDFWFARDGWSFEATLSEVGRDCPRRITVPVERTGAQSFRVPTAGPAGAKEVSLFGSGPEGSVGAALRWTTPEDGTMPTPNGYVSLVSGDDAEIWAYAGEAGLSDLGITPKQATLELTVTAANGKSMVLPIARDRQPDGCQTAGQVHFRNERAGEAEQPFTLGPAPFTYEARFTLDGKEYVGRAVWPRDEDEEESPNTPLTFDPPLPAYTGR